MECTTLCLQPKDRRLSQFKDYVFNSMAEINGHVVGASKDGLYFLDTGDKDGNDNIDAELTLAATDFGIPNFKTIRKIFFGFYSESDLEITVSVDKMEPQTQTLSVASSGYGSGFIIINDSMIGKYWMIKIANTSGGYFSIDSIDVLLSAVKASGMVL